MRRGGRTRPKPRRMARGGAARGRTRPAPRGRQMARGGRTRPSPRGRGRQFQAGGHTHDVDIGHFYTPHGYHGDLTGSTAIGGDHRHTLNAAQPGISPRPLPGGRGRRRGGRVTHQLRRGGMPRGRQFQAGGTGGECPVGTQRSAYGTCIAMDR